MGGIFSPSIKLIALLECHHINKMTIALAILNANGSNIIFLFRRRKCVASKVTLLMKKEVNTQNIMKVLHLTLYDLILYYKLIPMAQDWVLHIQYS